MNDQSLDLVAIINIIKRNSKQIIAATVTAMVLTSIIYLVKPKKYEAMTEFYTINPMYVERANAFKHELRSAPEIFGNENAVDKVMAMIKSDGMINTVISKEHLFEYFDLDSKKPKEVLKLQNMVRDNRKITRTEYYTIEVEYKDRDNKKAASVANTFVTETNNQLMYLYDSVNHSIEAKLLKKISAMDSSINTLTDTLSKLRTAYGIYNLLNPNSENITMGSVKGTNNTGAGMELIQNYESLKEQLLIDRANAYTLINEINASKGNSDINWVVPIYPALPPVKPAGLGLALTVLAAGLVVAFMMILYVLMRHFYRSSPNYEA